MDLQTARSVVRSSDETKKKSFLAANTLDGFGAHKDKKYPMPTVWLNILLDL